MITVYDMVDLPPIIPPWTTAQVEEAWPVRVMPWPPVLGPWPPIDVPPRPTTDEEIAALPILDPTDPWSEVRRDPA